MASETKPERIVKYVRPDGKLKLGSKRETEKFRKRIKSKIKDRVGEVADAPER